MKLNQGLECRFFITLLLLFLIVALPAKATEFDYLIIKRQAAPLQIANSDETYSGIVTDVVREIFKGSEYKVNIHAAPFLKLKENIAAGKYQNWIFYGAEKWSPPQNLNLSTVPIMSVKHTGLSAKVAPLRGDGIDDFLGRTIITLVGFEYPGLEPYIKHPEIMAGRRSQYKDVFISILQKPEELVFVEMDMRIRYNINQLRESGLRIHPDDFEYTDFSNVIPSYPVYLSLDPNMPMALQNFINERLIQLQHEGFLEKTVAKYMK